MTKKKGKKKQPQKKLTFKDIIQRYKSQDFKGALHHLSRIYLQPHERQDAKLMEADLRHRMAYDHFENFRYEEVPALFSGISPEVATDELALVGVTLTGLSHLYLGEWKKAAACLAASGNHELTRKFSFYYLLALLYDAPCEDFDAFLLTHNASNEALGTRTDYLRMVFHIRRGEWSQATAVLDGMERMSDSHRHNLLAFRRILSEELLSENGKLPVEKPDPAHIFPLYKILLGLSIGAPEMAYFSKLPTLAPLVELLNRQQNRHQLQQYLGDLCEKGVALPAEHFLFCLEHSPEKMRPYIAYNQVAALFKEDLQDNIKNINHLTDKYATWFFQVPESIFIYLKTVFYDEQSHKPATILQNVENWFYRFGKLVSPALLDEVGWTVSEIFLKTLASKKDTELIQRKIGNWAKTWDQVISFKFWLLADYSYNSGNIEKPALAMNLFALSRTQEHQKQLLNESFKLLSLPLEERMKEIFVRHSNPFQKEANQRYIAIYSKFQEQILVAIRQHPPILKNTVALDMLHLLSEQHKKMTVVQLLPLKPELLDNLRTAFAGLLTHFGKESSDPAYGKIWSSLQNREKDIEIATMFSETKTPESTSLIYRTMVLNGEAEDCANTIIQYLDDKHFPKHLPVFVSNFLQVLSENAVADAEKISARFFKSYNEIKAMDKCDCGNNLLLEIVDDMAPKLNDSVIGCRVLYQAMLGCGNLLTKENDEEDVIRVITLLSDMKWLMEKDQDFQPDKTFLLNLLDYSAKNGDPKSSKTVAGFRAFFAKGL